MRGVMAALGFFHCRLPLLLPLLLLAGCSLSIAQFDIETIEGFEIATSATTATSANGASSATTATSATSATPIQVRSRSLNANVSWPGGLRKFNCIVCDDIINANCQPWDKFSYSKNCYEDARIDKSRPVGCRKMVQQVEGRVYVSRQCTNLVDDSVQGCIDRVGTKNIKVTYCHCRERQNCNAAAELRVGWGFLLLLLLLPMITVTAAKF